MLPESFALLKKETSIGRDPINDVCLSWDGMSRNHARIVGSGGDVNLKNPSGSAIPSSFRVFDNGGINGTYVNGVRVIITSQCADYSPMLHLNVISQVKDAILRDGDVLGFGRGRLFRT